MTTPRLLLTLVLALAPATAWGQAPEPKRLSHRGSEVFRWLLHNRAKLKPLTPNEEFATARGQNLSETVLIVLGPWQGQPPPGGTSIQQWVTRVAEGGGAVLVAHDQSVSLSLGARLTQVQFTGERVITPWRPGREWPVFNRDEQAQFAVPFPMPGGSPLGELLHGNRPLLRVVNELPGTILNTKDNLLTPVAGFPPGAKFKSTGDPVAGTGHVFIAGTAAPHPNTTRPFRFLAVGDQAVFRNGEMMARDTDDESPTDNLEFADRVLTFLTSENGPNRRTKCLLIEDGVVNRDYDELTRMLRPPLPPLPKFDWEKLQPKLVDMGNQIIDKVQENDIPNRLMTGPNPDAPNSLFRILVGGLLTMASIWAVFALIRRVWGAREPTDLATAPPGGRPPPPPDGAAGVFGRRGKELAGRDNLLEPARAACRDLFDTVGRPPDPGPRLPKVVISDVVRKPETLRQALRDLWAVAYGRPAPVTAMRWAALDPLLTRALAAHNDGKWRFAEAARWTDDTTRSRGEA